MKKKILKSTKSTKTKSKSDAKHFFKQKGKLSFVHKAKSKKPLKFPSILRFFTEKHFLASLVLLILLVIIIVVGLDLYRNVKQKEEVDKERQEIISKIQYWQGITNKYKDYRDGYFQLAVLEYRLGNFKGSKFYLEKALAIDPNFEKGRELEKILNSKF